MDFIQNLPKYEGCQMIMVIVDQFSKHATFILAMKYCLMEKATQLFIVDKY